MRLYSDWPHRAEWETGLNIVIKVNLKTNFKSRVVFLNACMPIKNFRTIRHTPYKIISGSVHNYLAIKLDLIYAKMKFSTWTAYGERTQNRSVQTIITEPEAANPSFKSVYEHLNFIKEELKSNLKHSMWKLPGSPCSGGFNERLNFGGVHWSDRFAA
jgi:hypothetical protein